MNILLPLLWCTLSRARRLAGARTLPHVLAWNMGVIISIVQPWSKSNRKGMAIFFLELSKILENKGPY